MTDPKEAIKKKANVLRKTLAQLDKITGQAFIVTKRPEVAEFFGVSVHTIDVWLSKGMPGSRNSYDLHKIVLWLRTDGPWRPLPGHHGTAGSDEDLIEGPQSEWSEEYRKWKARIAELDYQERTGQLMSVDRSMHIWVEIVMPEVRGFAERVIRDHRNGTADDWQETCERIDKAIAREFSNCRRDNQSGPGILAADGDPPAPEPPAEAD